MKKFTFLLLCVLILSSCAPTVPPIQTSEVSETSEVLPTSTPAPTASPTPAPVLKVDPETKKVIDAQKVPYAVNELGQAVITVDGKEITLLNIANTKTDFGLAEDIINGSDEDGVRYLFTEIGGWAKEIALVNGAELPFGYDESDLATLNAMRALQYSENPTISPDVVEPKYFANFFQDNFFLGLQNATVTKDQFGPESTIFTKATQPFTEPTIMKMVGIGGQEFEVLMVTMKNPTKENPNQLINMFYFMGKEKFDIYTKDIPIEDIPAVTASRGQISPILAPPAIMNGVVIGWNPLARFDYEKDPEVVAMQKRGELLALFSPQEQADMEKIIAYWNGGGPGLDKITWYGIEYNVYTVSIDHIPEEFALHPLLLGFEAWTYGPRE